jgi:hypothetical protein
MGHFECGQYHGKGVFLHGDGSWEYGIWQQGRLVHSSKGKALIIVMVMAMVVVMAMIVVMAMVVVVVELEIG